MKRILMVLLVMFAATSVFNANVQTRRGRNPGAQKFSQAEKQEWENLNKRFIKYWPYASGQVWSLIHSYASKNEMERSLNLMAAVGVALSSKDPASLRKLNGPRGLKQKLAQLMNSKDDTVRGFAAIMLGIVGDQDYSPRIATLLDTKTDAESKHEVTVRGRAATALGILGANEYAPRIALMLHSENPYDRAGATSGLGLLKATEYANDVARLLDVNNHDFMDDDSPIYCLFDMGVAGNYKREIAHLLDDEIPGDRSETAAYALALLGAKEYAGDIAKLLKHKFREGNAAKALALLGAKEYTAEILVLLKDENAVNRQDGVLALGILGAREHAAEVARLLKDPLAFVSRAAALALVLMEANEYANEVLPLISQQKTGPYVHPEDFNALVKEQALQIDHRFTTLLAQMKAQAPVSHPK